MAKPKDICNFIRDNGSSRRVKIMRYITQDIIKKKISPISETTANNWLKDLKKDGKIKHRYNKYSLSNTKKIENQKKILKIKEPFENQDNTNQLAKAFRITQTFSETVEKQAKLAQSMQDTIFLLDSTMFLLDMICIDSPFCKNMISKTKYKCRIYTASIKKIIDEKFAHLLEKQCDNKYQKLVKDTWDSHAVKYTYETSMRIYRTRDFRDMFSDVILQIRQGCEDNCKYFAQRATYDEDAVYASCKLVSTSLNEICRNDYDLVVDSYKYDEKLGMLRVEISELKMLSPYTITQLYCNGENCVFDVNSEKKSIPPSYSDYTVSFYPGSEISDTSTNIISMMLGCVEFSFVLEGKHKTKFTFLDHIKNDVAQLDTVYPQYKSNTIMLTLKMGGKIKEVIK